MKTISAAILFLFTVSLSAQWVEQTTPTNNNNNMVFMVNGLTGYIAGFNSTSPGWGSVLKTTNGGVNWNALAFTSNLYFFSIFFTNSATGYVGGQSGVAYKTTNGGMNWTILTTRTNKIVYYIQFINDNTGFICGSQMIRRTTNAGTSWDTIPAPNNGSETFRMDFKDANTGFVLWAGIFYKTTNAGVNWVSSLTNYAGNSLQMIDEQNGFINAGAGILKTTNSGTNWTLIAPMTIYRSGIFFLNANTGYAYGGSDPPSQLSYIVKTTNGGLNWFEQGIVIPSKLLSLHFSGVDTGVAISVSRILATPNGGGNAIGIQQISQTVPKDFSLGQNYPNPFNPVTNIQFTVPKSAFVRLAVYDITGRELETLVSENLTPGTYKADWNASRYSSGVYFYTITSGNFGETKKMILIK